jgi:hypothetical protein
MWIGAAGDRDISLSEIDLGTHTHILGAPDKGKSRLVEHVIRQMIAGYRGLCLIDLHGTLYKRIVEWCEYNHYFGRRPILLFEPASNEWAFGLDPLRHEDIDFAVATMVDAIAAVWGQRPEETPLLKRCLSATFHALASKGLTLLEALELINPHNQAIRRRIVEGLDHPLHRQQWEIFANMTPRQFNEIFGSTLSRFNGLFDDRRMHYIFGQKDRTLDTRSLMDDGGMLLVNFAGIARNTARTLGTLLIHDFFIEATHRPEWPEHSFPFYLIIDEAHLFMNEDISNILNETRKFGLHLILSHQNLAQIRHNPLIYDGVLQSAQTKIVLGGATLEDAKLFAGEIYRFNPEKLKSLTTPVTVGHERVWLENETNAWSESSGYRYGDMSTMSDDYGSSSSKNRSQAMYGGEKPSSMVVESSGRVEGTSHSFGRSSSSSSFSTSNESSSRGSSETLQAIIEERRMQTYSIEEQTYEAAVKLKFQAPQHAIVRLPSGEVHEVEIPFVDTPYVSPERITRFRDQILGSMSCARRVEEVKVEIETRRNTFQQVPPKVSQIPDDDIAFTLTEEEPWAPKGIPPETIPVSALLYDDLE